MAKDKLFQVLRGFCLNDKVFVKGDVINNPVKVGFCRARNGTILRKKGLIVEIDPSSSSPLDSRVPFCLPDKLDVTYVVTSGDLEGPPLPDDLFDIFTLPDKVNVKALSKIKKVVVLSDDEVSKVKKVQSLFGIPSGNQWASVEETIANPVVQDPQALCESGSLTLFEITSPPTFDLENEPVVSVTDPRSISVIRSVEIAADFFAIEFAEILKSVCEVYHGGLKSGEELDDPANAVINGHGFSNSSSKDIGSFDICVILDASGSTRDGSGKFCKIACAAYFLDRLARKCRQYGSQMNLDCIIFGGLAKRLQVKDLESLIECLDVFFRDSSLSDLNFNYRSTTTFKAPRLTKIFSEIGSNTSILSAIQMGCSEFNPRDYGMMLVLTDEAIKDGTLVSEINSVDIPDKISPVMMAIGSNLNLSSLDRWTGVEFPLSQDLDGFLSYIQTSLGSKVEEIRDKVS